MESATAGHGGSQGEREGNQLESGKGAKVPRRVASYISRLLVALRPIPNWCCWRRTTPQENVTSCTQRASQRSPKQGASRLLKGGRSRGRRKVKPSSRVGAAFIHSYVSSGYWCEASYMTHHTRDRGRPPIPGVAASHADSMPQEPPDRTGHDSGQALVRTPPVSGSAIMLAGEGRRKEPRVRFILAAALSRAPHRGPTWPHVCDSMLASAGPAHALPGWLERRRLAATGSQILL